LRGSPVLSLTPEKITQNIAMSLNPTKNKGDDPLRRFVYARSALQSKQ